MKKNRHERLLQFIKEREIETQEELAELLIQDGFQVTQATISRDIRDLNLIKVTNKNGRQSYVIMKSDDHQLSDKYIRVLKDGFVSMDMAQNILVIKTVAGMAMAVATAVDAMNLSEIVGSIAGDDTIMMAVRTTEDTAIVMEKIQEILSGK